MMPTIPTCLTKRDFYTSPQVAFLLGCSLGVAIRLMDAGHMAAYRPKKVSGWRRVDHEDMLLYLLHHGRFVSARHIGWHAPLLLVGFELEEQSPDTLACANTFEAGVLVEKQLPAVAVIDFRIGAGTAQEMALVLRAKCPWIELVALVEEDARTDPNLWSATLRDPFTEAHITEVIAARRRKFALNGPARPRASSHSAPPTSPA